MWASGFFLGAAGVLIRETQSGIRLFEKSCKSPLSHPVSPIHPYCGQNPAPPNTPWWKPLFVGIHRGSCHSRVSWVVRNGFRPSLGVPALPALARSPRLGSGGGGGVFRLGALVGAPLRRGGLRGDRARRGLRGGASCCVGEMLRCYWVDCSLVPIFGC